MGALVKDGLAESGARAAAPVAVSPPRAKPKFRAWWMKQLITWHWISAAVSLAAMLLFAITGITLNHAASIAATPVVTTAKATVPPHLMRLLGAPHAPDAPLPDAVADDLALRLHLDARGRPADWSDDDVYVAMPGPGRDAWISIARATGVATSEVTDRGWIAWANDLHKGRNTGGVWFWFIDVFAAACVLFSLTGLLLLQLHARRRPLTWPMVGLGLALPLILAVIFIH
ncbi:PepSY-associated TM helix domain-containing protein [Sphingomonas sp. NFR15]|uniref:PepSY-associated TM helix domain-containing protein n=1 Tax=Sphingomonas sp. NFR15 TaxID=1566282 RepID=UPI00088063FF|nr:PepSY-associated TM helix domain-containing protein [Sphingomonas sp. NFR15]SDA36480.1 hypothetical protein SAMN03159340_03685 [Sphingomonas sp. NFR15]